MALLAPSIGRSVGASNGVGDQVDGEAPRSPRFWTATGDQVALLDPSIGRSVGASNGVGDQVDGEAPRRRFWS